MNSHSSEFDAPPVESGNSVSNNAATPRREFLQRLAAAGTMAAGAVLASGCASASALTTSGSAATGRTQSRWDMSWREKLGKYKTAYDSPEIMDAAALHFASAAMSGYKEALGVEKDFTPVLILRHAASVMVLNDAMWSRMAIGEARKLKDPASGEPALRNPFIAYKSGDKHSLVGREAGLDTLIAAGAIVLTCNRALTGAAHTLRRKETSLTQDAAMSEILKAVLPGVYVMPNGIFAVSASQDVGCNYMRVLV